MLRRKISRENREDSISFADRSPFNIEELRLYHHFKERKVEIPMGYEILCLLLDEEHNSNGYAEKNGSTSRDFVQRLF